MNHQLKYIKDKGYKVVQMSLTEEDRQAYIIWRDDVDCLQGEISGMIEAREG
jgi:hypothetical protein